MAVLRIESIVKKVTKAIKRRLAPCKKVVVQDLHKEEADENALNEALEARLMEIIASSPALQTPVTIQVGDTAILATQAQDPHSLVPSMVQTSCQQPSGQEA